MQVKRLFEAWAEADRLALLTGLGLVVALAWGYLIYMGWGMEHMEVGMHMAFMPRMTQWGPVDLLLVFIMWAIMMVAMMLPSAAPMILAFAAVDRQRRAGYAHALRVGAFVAGYLAMWTGFSLCATGVQWGLLEARLISPMMRSVSPMLGGTLLIAAGIFQFSRWKQACLVGCRSPLSFLTLQWRSGTSGALRMGLRHGVDCLGCCWLLMALLFVLGVMNVLWIAALSAFVLTEKSLSRYYVVSLLTGVALIGWGVLVLTGVAA